MTRKFLFPFFTFVALLFFSLSAVRADGEAPTGPEDLFESFTAAEKTALSKVDEQNEISSELKLKEENLSTDDLIFSLAAKVDELKQKSHIKEVVALSTQKPRLAKPIGSKTVYSFKEGDIYEVRAGVDRVTDISLQPGETLTSIPVSGDTVRWKIKLVQSGNPPKETVHVILKPLNSDIETNLVLTTDKRVYHLRAVAGDWYMPTISWNYPDEDAALLKAQIKKQKRTEPIKVTPEKLNFNYEMKDDDLSWSPTRVFDDGRKTYIQMPKSISVREAPALFVVEDDKPMLVNYRVKGDFYIVDRLFKEAELRVGTKSKVEIFDSRYRKNFLERLFD